MNFLVGTCEQRDTGQGHPDKGTGHCSDDYLQNHVHFCWNGPGSSRRLPKSASRVWCRENGQNQPLGPFQRPPITHVTKKLIGKELNENFNSLCDWFVENKLSIHFGEDKTKSILFGTKRRLKDDPKIEICRKEIKIKQHKEVKYLGWFKPLG